MAIVFLVLFVIGHSLLIADGKPKQYARFILDNPGDMSTYLGYKDHKVPDMTSLVNEAKAQAHGQSVSVSGSGTGRGGSSGGNSLSFAGTNLWRCDAHVVEVCDLNCLDVDPKDGCPFCIQSCQTTLHGSTGKGSSSASQSGPSSSSSTATSSQTPSGSAGTGAQTGTSQSGSPLQQPSGAAGGQSSSSQSGSPFQQPSAGTGVQSVISQSGSLFQQPSSGTGTQTVNSQSGTASQQPSGLTGTGSGNTQSGSIAQQPSGLAGTGTLSGTGQTGSLSQLPSGLSGTGNQAGGQGATGSAQTTAKPACPQYPPNCPAVYTKLVNGCLVCTVLQQPGVVSNTPPTTAPGPTCPPKHCVAPCNVGIVMGADGCPKCKCPDHV